MIGTIISQYRIIEKLGQGGMGVVYRAEDMKLDRSVAIKMLPHGIGADEDQKTRFLQEARAASAIDHVNIGAIYGIDETPDGDLFIAMAYYEGETLKERIRKGQVPLEEAVGIATQIARGMAQAHEKGIIHRDLKPANIILTRDGTVKIIDFGLAKFVAGAQLTRSGISVGTVAYMSPEQIRGEGVDARSDIWALGVVLFEMLAGKLPFRGEHETALLYSVSNEPPIDISTHRSDVPEDLHGLISGCLEKEPGKRIQSMGEIVQLLQAFGSRGIAPSPVRTRPPSGQNSAPIRKPVFLRKRSIVAATVVALIAIAGWYYAGRPSIATTNSEGKGESLAVLPLVNRGGAEQQFYADGLTDDIRQEFSRYPRLLVISKVSSSAYRADSINLQKVSGDLGVRYILHGELQLLAESMQIRISLYNSDAGKNVWENTYDIYRKDILEAKTNLLASVASKLGLPFNRKSGSVVKADVYELLLHGIYIQNQGTKEGALLADEYFSEAVQKDSNYIPGILNLASTRIENVRRGWIQSPRALTDAERMCNKVLAIDSGDGRAQALAILGGIASQRGQVQESMALLLRSLELDPGNASALTQAAILYMDRFGQAIKAVPLLKKLVEMDPENSLYLSNLGVAYGQLKNYTEAIRTFQRAAELDPANPLSFSNMAYAYERIGKYDSAITNYSITLRKAPTEAQTYESLASVLFFAGKAATADSILANGIRLLPDNPQLLYAYGMAKILEGKRDEAVRSFEDGLRITNFNVSRNPAHSDNYSYQAIFYARLGKISAATAAIERALARDSTDEEILIKASRTYAILGRKQSMIEFFKKARSANPEYDLSYLTTAIDFSKFRSDPDLLFAARVQ